MRHQPAVKPPSAATTAPVMKLERGEARKHRTSAISSGRATRPRGCALILLSRSGARRRRGRPLRPSALSHCHLAYLQRRKNVEAPRSPGPADTGGPDITCLHTALKKMPSPGNSPAPHRHRPQPNGAHVTHSRRDHREAFPPPEESSGIQHSRVPARRLLQRPCVQCERSRALSRPQGECPCLCRSRHINHVEICTNNPWAPKMRNDQPHLCNKDALRRASGSPRLSAVDLCWSRR